MSGTPRQKEGSRERMDLEDCRRSSRCWSRSMRREMDGHRWSRAQAITGRLMRTVGGEAGWDAPAAELSGEAGCSSFVQQVGLLFACFAVFETWSPIA